MIRIYVVEDTLDDEGGSTLMITGHADEVVCAGVSAIWHSTCDGYERMAKEFPHEMSFSPTIRKFVEPPAPPSLWKRIKSTFAK